MENFSSKKHSSEKGKLVLMHKKDCAMQSLKEVNIFLCQLKNIKKGILLYKIFK